MMIRESPNCVLCCAGYFSWLVMFRSANRLLQPASWPMFLSALLLSALREVLGLPESACGGRCADQEVLSRVPRNGANAFRPTPASFLASPFSLKRMADGELCATQSGAEGLFHGSWLVRVIGRSGAEHQPGGRSSFGVLRPLRLASAQCALPVTPPRGGEPSSPLTVKRRVELRVLQR